MSIKNKKITELKYFDAIHTFDGKIDFDEFARVPHALDVFMPKKLLAIYWRAFGDICISLAWSVDYGIKDCIKASIKKLSNKPIGDVASKKFLYDSLNGFVSNRLKMWTMLIPALNDLYALYIRHNKLLGEREFILLDFWFSNLLVIDELMLAFEELNLKLHFYRSPLLLGKLFEFNIHEIFLLEPNEENLKSLNCDNWNKEDYVKHIYKQFSKIDVNILYQWLVYKKIENIYESKEIYVYQYLTNSINGLNSLSLTTLKLLAINPILDLDHVRKLQEERTLYFLKQDEAEGPQTKEQLINSFMNTLKFAIIHSNKNKK